MSDDEDPPPTTDFDAWMAEFRSRLPAAPKAQGSGQSPHSQESRKGRPDRSQEAWAPAPARRRGRRAWVVMVAIVGAVVGVSLAFSSGHHPSTRPKTTGGGPTSQPPLRIQPSAPATTAADEPIPTAEALFPAHLEIGATGYDRIATLTSDDCQPDDAIPQQFADRIQQLGGCIGARFALYVDSAQQALITVGAIATADPTAVVQLMPDGDPSDTIGMLPLPAGSTLRPRPGAPPILGDAAASLGRIMIGVGTPTVGVKPDYGRLSGQIRDLTARISPGFLTIPGSAAPSATA